MSWAPTRKWWAATVTAVATIGTDWAVQGDWNQTLTIAAIGIGAQRVIAWLVPNDVKPDSYGTG